MRLFRAGGRRPSVESDGGWGDGGRPPAGQRAFTRRAGGATSGAPTYLSSAGTWYGVLVYVLVVCVTVSSFLQREYNRPRSAPKP